MSAHDPPTKVADLDAAIQATRQVNVFSNDGHAASISVTADPALIDVHADGAEHWHAPDSKVIRLLGAAGASVAGDPDVFAGTNEQVGLNR